MNNTGKKKNINQSKTYKEIKGFRERPDEK